MAGAEDVGGGGYGATATERGRWSVGALRGGGGDVRRPHDGEEEVGVGWILAEAGGGTPAIAVEGRRERERGLSHEHPGRERR